jgi:hypothetical protein
MPPSIKMSNTIQQRANFTTSPIKLMQKELYANLSLSDTVLQFEVVMRPLRGLVIRSFKVDTAW